MNAKLLAAVTALTVSAAFCGEVHTNSVKNGISNWNSTDSYDDGRIPQPGDVVNIPANCTVTVNGDDEDSFAIVSALGRLCPLDSQTSKVVFDIPESVTKTLEAPIYYKDGYGVIEKTGLGELVLGSITNVTNTGNTRRDYRTNKLTIGAGTLTMRQGVPKGEYNYGAIDIAKDALLVLHSYGGGASSSSAYFIQITSLTGEGTVTCYSTSATETQLRTSSRCTFAGKITGSVRVFVSSSLNLTGVESDNTLETTVYGANYGILGLKRIGNAGEPSSAGTADTLYIDYRGGTLLYLGEGEETSTDKKITVSSNDSTGPAQFDAGAYGGLTFYGAWSYNQNYPRMFDFVIKGSNTLHECVLANKISDWTVSKTNCSFYIIKRGTGIWRFADHPERTFGGGIAVEEGTLRFDSLDETNRVCSLGKATNLQTPYRTRYDSSRTVDYAYALGMTNAAGAVKSEGTFEYTGTNGVVVGTRTMVLKGDGRIKSDSAARFRYAGISAVGAGLKTLTLDGSGVNGNEIVDIANGEGQVGVTKEGTGTWTLSGDLSFSGPVAVRGGTLKIAAVNTNYTWFVWNVKQLTSSAYAGSSSGLMIAEVGLFDADGNILSKGIKDSGNYAELNPGQVAMNSRLSYAHQNGRKPQACFDGVINDSVWEVIPYRTPSWYTVSPDKPDTWFPLVFRLPATVKVPVASYDIAVAYGNNSASNKGKNARAYSLLGSVDGIHWDVLHEVTDTLAYDDSSKNDGMTIPQRGDWCWRWMFTDTTWNTTPREPHTGKSIAGCTTKVPVRLANVSSYEVADGATLVAEGDPIEIGGLSFDCSRSAGAFENFTLAADGTIRVANLPADVRDVKLPISLADFDDARSLTAWAVEVDGTVTDKWEPSIVGDELHLVKRGLVLIIR